MTLKTKDIVGPRKHPKDSIVITEEDTSIGPSKSVRRKKSWDEIHKGLAQLR